MATQAEAGGSQAPAELLLEGGGGAEDGAEKAVLEEWLPAGPTAPQTLPEGGALCTCLPVPRDCSASQTVPIPSFSEERRRDSLEAAFPGQCVTRETQLPGTSSPPGPGAHTPGHPSAARSPRALCSQEALGQELRTCYLQGSRVLEASAELPALRSLACRFRGSWTPTVQLTRSSSPANSWG